MTTRISIDIESASNKAPKAAVVQIGIAHMKGSEILDHNGLNLKVDITDYRTLYDGKFHVDIGTMLWWATQDSVARNAAFGVPNPHNIDINDERVPLIVALNLMCENISSVKGKKEIWAKPPTFDLAILGHALEVCSLPIPWHYREERCLRTLLAMTPKDASIHGMPFDGAQHDAYVDAVHQLKQIRACLTVAGRIR